MKSILQNSITNSLTYFITNSLTYFEYKTTVTELFKKGLVTGNDQTEARIHSTEINEARVRRLDKTLVVIDEAKNFLENPKRNYGFDAISCFSNSSGVEPFSTE